LRHDGYASASQIVSKPPFVQRAGVLEDLLERLHRQLHDADPERRGHSPRDPTP
jgi:hypothetical protein